MTTYREALAGLGAAQKSNYGVPAYSRFVNRRLGRYFAAAACRAGLSPSQVTVMSAAASGTGIVMLATVQPSTASAVAITLALVLGYALDAADGQLARLTKSGSMAGEWLDHSIDAMKISALHLAVLIGLYRFVDVTTDRWYLVPIAFELVAVARFSSMLLIDQLRRSVGFDVGAGQRGTSLLRSCAVLVIDYGLLCLLFLSWARSSLFLALYALLCVGNWVYFLVVSVKHYVELRSLADRQLGH